LRGTPDDAESTDTRADDDAADARVDDAIDTIDGTRTGGAVAAAAAAAVAAAMAAAPPVRLSWCHSVSDEEVDASHDSPAEEVDEEDVSRPRGSCWYETERGKGWKDGTRVPPASTSDTVWPLLWDRLVAVERTSDEEDAVDVRRSPSVRGSTGMLLCSMEK